MTESGTICYQQVYFQHSLAKAKTATYLALKEIPSNANHLNNPTDTQE